VNTAEHTEDADRAAEQETPATVYTPEPLLSSPGKLLRSMCRDLLASRELAWRLTVRDIRARYRQSALGILWAFLPPIATTVIFVILKRQGATNVADTNIPYPAFLMISTVFWQLFTRSLNAPMRAVSSGKAMLGRVNFPREALILSAIGGVLFEFGVRVLVLIPVFIIFPVPVTGWLLLAPFAVLALILLGITIGMMLVPVGALYTDVSAALPTLTGLWFFLTPVVYPVPSRWPFSLLIHLNPVSPLLAGARDLATGAGLPHAVPFAMACALMLVGLFVMWIVYRVSLPILTERFGA